MAILQLNPPIPLETPHGPALAHLIIDYGPEHNLLWVCFNDSNGECWTWEIQGPGLVKHHAGEV
jgi:hypothetical protein